MSWYRLQYAIHWQNRPYTNNANPQFLHPIEIAPIQCCTAPPRRSKPKVYKLQPVKLIKPFYPGNIRK
jgi:hypothetical protein